MTNPMFLFAADEPNLFEAYGTYILAGGAVLIGLLVLILLLGRRPGRKPVDPEAGLREHLADYPPAPGEPGPRRLLVQELPARVRLVVVAAAGKESAINPSEVEAFLDQVVRGLGDSARQDKPRVRVWPPQLSKAGFAPTFHRLVRRPEADGTPSHWVLVAGEARLGKWPVLLGLALWTDQSTTLGKVTVPPGRWGDAIRVGS